MIVILIFTIIFFAYGLFEQINHFKKINKIPIRIHVNGTRGKSTTTRLIAAGLRESGLKVLAKTTGTLPRLILEDGTEIPVKRKSAANIKEQMKILSLAAQKKVDALVLECMAVNPENQWISENKMIKSTIGVITNVREDHLEEMGTNLEQIADTLKLTMPNNGTLVTAENVYLSTFQEEANLLNTKLIKVNPNSISNEIMEKFNYMNFKENVSIALKVNQLIGVKKNIALKGMLKAKPDPGALKIYKFSHHNKSIFFVNAFAANDKNSILLIWKKIKKKFNINTIPFIGVINSREDRILRSIQLSHLLAKEIILFKLFLVGTSSHFTRKALLKSKVPINKITNIEKISDPEKVLKKVFDSFKREAIIIGFGNTKGMGQKLIDYFNDNGEEV